MKQIQMLWVFSVLTMYLFHWLTNHTTNTVIWLTVDIFYSRYLFPLQAENIHILGEQIGTTLAKAEEEGAKGDVQMSLKLMEEVEELKKKKTLAEVVIF